MHHIHKCIHKYAHTQFPRIRQHITFRLGLHDCAVPHQDNGTRIRRDERQENIAEYERVWIEQIFYGRHDCQATRNNTRAQALIVCPRELRPGRMCTQTFLSRTCKPNRQRDQHNANKCPASNVIIHAICGTLPCGASVAVRHGFAASTHGFPNKNILTASNSEFTLSGEEIPLTLNLWFQLNSELVFELLGDSLLLVFFPPE
jgi:hypothetical protein